MAKEYTLNQTRKIAGYIDSYATLQAMGQIVSMTEAIVKSYSDDSNNKSLRDAAVTLRKQIAKFREQVPKEIREQLTSGKTESQLESLATNILLQD